MCSSDLVGTANANGSGAWSLAGVKLATGANAFTVRVADAAGNTSVTSEPLTVTLDQTAPTTPAAPKLLTADDTGASASDNITSRTLPTFTGTVEAGAKVDLYVDNVLDSSLVTPASGGYAIKLANALADGDHLITTKATDKAGNTSLVSPSLKVTIGTSTPSIASVTGPAAKSYKAGDVLSFSVTFTSPVTVTGVPTIDLTVGTTVRKAVYTSGTGTSTLVFRYTVVAGDNDADGVTLASSIILPTGAALKSTANGNNATLSLSPPDTSAVLVDTVAPLKPGLPNLVADFDSGSSSTDDYTNLATVTLDGTAEIGRAHV